jgi:hypothetical protein
MSSFIDEAPHQRVEGCEQICTFSITGQRPINQAIYICRTCNKNENTNECCCSCCASICHADHDIEFIAFGNAYCDCGEKGCRLFALSHSDLLPNSAIIEKFQNKFKGKVPKFESFAIHHVDYSLLIEQIKTLIKQSKETFWLSATESPCCYLEQVCQAIGLYHLRRLCSNTSEMTELLPIAGFEWWMQVKSPELSENFGVDLHYDKDEAMAEKYNLGLFPTISTVTYVTDQLSVPTMVLDCTASTPVGTGIRDCFLSLPIQGKHIAFDGALLHGAPCHLAKFATLNWPVSSSSNALAERITFLVNVWIGHQPATVQPLSLSLSPSLSLSTLSLSSTSTSVAALTGEILLSESAVTERESAVENVSALLRVSVRSSDVYHEDVEEEEDVDDGWLTIPFVSEKSDWGKDEEEAGLELSLWLPAQQSLTIFHHNKQQQQQQQRQIQKKKSSNHSKKKSTSTSSPLSSTPHEISSSPISSVTNSYTNFHVHYLSDEVAAKLEYENIDEEDDDNDNNNDEDDKDCVK